MTLFDEPSTKNTGRPGHPPPGRRRPPPSAATVNFAAGYSADVVTRRDARPTRFDAVSAATKFSDTRHLVHGGFGFERADGGISFAVAYGWESDYKSIVALRRPPTTISTSTTSRSPSPTRTTGTASATPTTRRPPGCPSIASRSTSSAGCFTTTPGYTTRKLTIDTFEPSLSWTMTPRLVVQGGATIQILDGFQANPYRKVLVGSQSRTPQEHLPEFRQRYALFARLAYAFPELRGSTLAMVRGYDDSWAVRAFTADLVGTKYLGQSMLLSVRAHYHLQGGASFYRDAVELPDPRAAGQYWTGDRELSPMGNYLLGGKLAFFRRPQQERSSWFVEMELGAKYEFLLYRPESPFAPNADRTFAHIVQGAFAMRF